MGGGNNNGTRDGWPMSALSGVTPVPGGKGGGSPAPSPRTLDSGMPRPIQAPPPMPSYVSRGGDGTRPIYAADAERGTGLPAPMTPATAATPMAPNLQAAPAPPPGFLGAAPDRFRNLWGKIMGHPDPTGIDPFAANAETPGASFFAMPGVTGDRLARYVQNNPGMRGQGLHFNHMIDELRNQGGVWLGQRPEGGTVFSTEQDPATPHISPLNDIRSQLTQQGGPHGFQAIMNAASASNPNLAALMRQTQQSGKLGAGNKWDAFYKMFPV